MEYVVEKYTLLHHDVKLPNGNHIDECYDYILLPYKLESEKGQYDYFQNEFAIDITWEVISGNLSSETLDGNDLKNYKTADIIKPYVYGKLYFLNENNTVNAFKINYTNEKPITKVKATYSCGGFFVTREYEIEVIVSALEKHFIEKGFDYNSISKGWYKDSGGKFMANGNILYSYTSFISFDSNVVRTTYKHLSGVSTVLDYRFIYNTVDETITVEDTLNSFEYDVYNIGDPYKVYSYELTYFENAYNEFIEMLKVYDEVQALFFNGENATPYYQSQNYPSLSNFVITGK